MNPMAAGVIAAIALIGAFVVGSMIDFDTGGDNTAVKIELGDQGPLEKAGEAIDEAASDATK